MAKEKVTMAVCDALRCYVRREHSSSEPAEGIHIKSVAVVDSSASGMTVKDIYACSLGHVQSAIESRIEDEYEQGH